MLFRSNVEVNFKTDSRVMRGVVVAKLANDHPLNKLVVNDIDVTDLRFENSSKVGK